jgi:hypothetical protein
MMTNRHFIYTPVANRTVQCKLCIFYLLLVLAGLFVCVCKVNSSTFRGTALPPYIVSFSTTNFNVQTLTAVADDLNDPQQAKFSLRNGTRLWYGISLQSTPAGMQLFPVEQGADLVTTTFLSLSPFLLPPAEIVPFDQGNTAHKYAQLRLKVAFSGPGQQVRLNLNPEDTHALTLDICDMLLHLLGQRNSGVQIGLLAPGVLKELFDTTSSLHDFSTLVNDYRMLMASAPDESAMLAHAYDCAVALVALMADPTEQVAIADLLWKLQGKVISHASILNVVSGFTRTQSGLAVEAYIKNIVLSYGTALLPQNDPIVLLRTASPVKSTPTAASTRVLPVVPTAVASFAPVRTPSSAISTTRTVLPRSPTSIQKFKATPTIAPTPIPEPTPIITPVLMPTPTITPTQKTNRRLPLQQQYTRWNRPGPYSFRCPGFL